MAPKTACIGMGGHYNECVWYSHWGIPGQQAWGIAKERAMKYGARNQIIATVKSVKTGDVMSLVKFGVKDPCQMASVLTTESVKEMKLKRGDQVTLVVKAIHVLPVKE